MAYTDLTSSFTYRALLTHQLMDALAESDATFNNLLTAASDFPNNLRFDNAKYLQGEIAAGSTYKKMIGLDASNIVQLGESGTEVRVPADPTNVLGVATKQYVDGVQMFQTQPKTTATTGSSGTYATIINLTATTRGHLRSLHVLKDANPGTISVRITIDGGTPVVITSSSIAGSQYRNLQQNYSWSSPDQATEYLTSSLLDIAFNTSLLIEATGSVGNGTIYVIYDKIP